MTAHKKTFLQPLDRIAIALMLILSLLILLVILQGDAVRPSVRSFSWQNQKVGADNLSFRLTFSRPMNIKSVEENLKIEPPLAGKFSWSGPKMFYTLLTPAPYGAEYKVTLENAQEKFAVTESQKKLIKPFTGTFSTRDRVLLYIGADQQNWGQLVLYNLTQGKEKVLTPKDLVVMDFKPFPNGEKILFSARTKNNPDLLSAQLYTVTTGVAASLSQQEQLAGRVDLILDSKKYQNLKFDVSSDGRTIVVQRGDRSNPSDFGLWFMSITDDSREKPDPQRLQSKPGGDFVITADGQAVAVAQGEGTAILPLKKDVTDPVDFLPKYGLPVAFHQDKSREDNYQQAAMVKFNTDYTRELFLVTTQGEQKQLLRTTGTIHSCQFDNASPTLYCLLTQLVPGEIYQEQPYVVAIDLKTGQQKPLLLMPPEQRNIQMSLSPDGLGLLFDQVVPLMDATGKLATQILTTDDGQAIATSSLWLMPLLPISDDPVADELKPEQLPLVGFRPRWLP